MDVLFTLKTGGSNEGKILTFAISGCSELMTIPFRTRAGRVSFYDLIRFHKIKNISERMIEESVSASILLKVRI